MSQVIGVRAWSWSGPPHRDLLPRRNSTCKPYTALPRRTAGTRSMQVPAHRDQLKTPLPSRCGADAGAVLRVNEEQAAFALPLAGIISERADTRLIRLACAG